MIYTPEMNDGRHVFTFGSNTRGIHGAGAAKEAKRNWGAMSGAGIGRRGMSYAIPTKDGQLESMALESIQNYVAGFIAYAKSQPHLTFLVTAIGCGLAGYAPAQIAPMFRDAPSNCVLPDEFKAVLEASRTAQDESALP